LKVTLIEIIYTIALISASAESKTKLITGRIEKYRFCRPAFVIPEGFYRESGIMQTGLPDSRRRYRGF